MKRAQVGIIMGSETDLKVMKQTAEILKSFEIPYEIKIVSAHRTPQKMVDYAQSAQERGLQVLIAGAGGAAHLPGMVASLTTLPVIGVPVTVNTLNGLDALLSIVQMPKGIPVATVAIDGAANAGLLAARIISANDKHLSKKLLLFQKQQAKKVLMMNKRLKIRN